MMTDSIKADVLYYTAKPLKKVKRICVKKKN